MVLDIFNDIGNGINDTFNKFGKFVENNFDNPFFWVIMFFIILLTATYVISELGGK